jgi:hypothetical protein
VTDVSDRPWSGITRASYATAAEFCAACLIDENEQGYTHSKARCKLPVYEPQSLGGRLNRNAVHAAANRLVRQRGGVDVPLAVKQRTAQRLVELFGVIGDPPPQALRRLATRTHSAVSGQRVGAGGLDGPSL